MFFLGWVENIVGKRIKCWLQAFSLFPTVFSKAFFFRVVKSRDCVEKELTRNHDFKTTLNKKPFENIVGKGENAGNQHFLLFPQCFQTLPNQISNFHSHLFLGLQNAFNLDQSRILSFGNGLKDNFVKG